MTRWFEQYSAYTPMPTTTTAGTVTDNRTTELLHKLLDERGVMYETDADECCYDEQPSTTWDFNLCGLEMTVTAKEFVDIEGKTYLEMDFHHAFTPEQAIAATLGKPKVSSDQEETVRSFLRKISPIRDWDYLGEHEHALIADFISDIAATLGSGTLTAEQVSKATYAHSIHADCADADWQAIADELNAELGSGTCEWQMAVGEGFCEGHIWRDDNGERAQEPFGVASHILSCGHIVLMENEGGVNKPLPNFCSVCGRKVVSA